MDIKQEHQQDFITYLRDIVNIDSLYQKFIQQLPTKECPVCYDEFRPDELIDCVNNHTAVCLNCLHHLQEPICPVCREDLPNPTTLESPPAPAPAPPPPPPAPAVREALQALTPDPAPAIDPPPITSTNDRRTYRELVRHSDETQVSLEAHREGVRVQYLAHRTSYRNTVLRFNRATATMLVYRSPTSFNPRTGYRFYIEIKKNRNWFSTLLSYERNRDQDQPDTARRNVIYRTYIRGPNDGEFRLETNETRCLDLYINNSIPETEAMALDRLNYPHAPREHVSV